MKQWVVGWRWQMVVATLLLVGVAPFAASGVSRAQPATGSAMSVFEAEDWASAAWGDPIDFQNSEDMHVEPHAGGGVVQGPGLRNVSVSDGQLHFRGSENQFFQIGFAASGALAWGRDTDGHPASNLMPMSLRVRASAPAILQASWFSCDGLLPSCEMVGTQADVAPTWRTVALRAPEGPTRPVYAVRLVVRGAPAPVDFDVDWVRVHKSGERVPIPPSDVVWYEHVPGGTECAPGAPATFPVDGPDAGPLYGLGGALFPADRFPPGTYCVWSQSAGIWSDPLRVDVVARPAPVILDPSLVGGADWATTVRGDGWDFSQASDVAWVESATVNVAGGVARGTGAPPRVWDSQIGLPTSGKKIDAAKYHRLFARVRYDGAFGLDNLPGQGMNARLIWREPGQIWSNSDDIVVFPGWNDIAVDLKTSPPSKVNEPGEPNSLGWGGPGSELIEELRFDPVEDPAPRTWDVDELRITANQVGTPGFDIRFRDNAWAPGTTARLYVDRDRPGIGTEYPIAAGVPVTDGVNTFHWSGTDVWGNPLPAPATWYVRLELVRNLGAQTAVQSATSAGAVDMPAQPSVPVPGPPTGVLAVAGAQAATVSWNPPADPGGAPIVSFVVTVQPGGGQVYVAADRTSVTVTGLTPGEPTTFTVTARNPGGTGPPSSASNEVVPTAVAGGGFVAERSRILDSRTDVGGWNRTGLGPGQTKDLVVPTTQWGATAAVLNVTVTNPTAGSYLTVYPAGAPRPLAANLNFGVNQTIPNLVTVALGNDNAVSIFNALGGTDVVVDMLGVYSPAGVGYQPVTPYRALDTRATGRVQNWHAIDAIDGATPNMAVAMNVTVTNPDQAGYLSVEGYGSVDNTANLLFGRGETVSNLVIASLSANGDLKLAATAELDVIVDVVGLYAPGGSLFHPVNPTRVLDSRTANGGWLSTPLGADDLRTVPVAGTHDLPNLATAVVANVTVTAGTANSYLAVTPTPGAKPAQTASLLFGRNRTLPNLTMPRLGTDGALALYNQRGTTHVVTDVAGWFD